MKISAAQYSMMYGPTVGDKVRLADTNLIIEVEKDYTVYGEESKFGGGKTLRDGMGQSVKTTSADGDLDLVITNALIIDAKTGIVKADIFGVSMGGMIAQYFAVDYPEKVNKLILAVTAAKPNPLLTEAIGEWINLAKKEDHASFMDSNLRRIYSEDYYRKNKWMIPAVAKLTKPKSYDGQSNAYGW